MTDPAVRYPAGPITPAGAYHILHDRIPQVYLRSPDGSVVFNMMGGLAIHDPTIPERVNIRDITGLIPPWRVIDQQGATEDGVTFVDSFYDPCEPELKVRIKGRNPAYIRKVGRHLMDSLHDKETSELGWITHELGHWWADVRWFKVPVDPVGGIATNRQDLSLRLRADSALWRSYDNVADFGFVYEDFVEEFNFVDTDDIGTNYTLAYTGAGPSHISSNGEQALWVKSGTTTRTVVARRNAFTSITNNQVVTMVFGAFMDSRLVGKAYNDLWARMPSTGTPGAQGVRLRVGQGFIRLSYFIGGVETIMRELSIFNSLEAWVPPWPGDKWQLVAGYDGIAGQDGDERMFKVIKNGATIMSFKETGTGSPLGASNRAVGFGMEAGGDIFDQANPSGILKIAAGDNSAVSQVGFLERINAGDQPMWDRFTCFGPGIFRFSNGPGSTDMIEFGPIEANQIMYLRTDPRKRGVDDLTVIPPTPQQLDFWQQALKDYISWATGNNVPPYYQAIESQFGIKPPQGNPYSLLKGRWSNPIPAKSPGKKAEKYHIRVEIDDGNADSRVIAAGTPLRRNPY